MQSDLRFHRGWSYQEKQPLAGSSNRHSARSREMTNELEVASAGETHTSRGQPAFCFSLRIFFFTRRLLYAANLRGF